MSKEKIKLPLFSVRAGFAAESYDEKENTIELVWSAGAKGLRTPFFSEPYWEELSMESDAVRLDRLNNKAPLLSAHNSYELSAVLGVVEKAWIDGKKGKAKVKFSNREDVKPIIQDVRDGVIANVSVGYRVYKYEKTDSADEKYATYRAIDWEPMEVSLVPIGFDDAAKVRSAEDCKHECEIVSAREFNNENPKETDMPNDKEVLESGAEGSAKEVEVKEAKEEATKAERKRCSEIAALCRKFGFDEKFEKELVEGEKTIDQARAAIIDALAAKEGKELRNTVKITHGDQDETQVRAEGMVGALLHRSNPAQYKLEEKAKAYRGMSLLRMAEEFVGAKARGMTKSELAQRALSSSDFPLILADVAHKSLRGAYELQPRTFKPWTRQGVLPDYKEASRLQLGEVSDLDQIAEGGEYQESSFGENREKIKLLKYGKIVHVTEELIVNDDLDAMARIPALMGAAAARLESKLVYDVLLTNPTMSDSVALFHASHGNLPTAAAITGVSLGAAKALMRKQKGVDSKDYLDLQPAFLIVGPDKEMEARQILNGEILATKSSDVNIYKNSMDLVVESRITGNKWFLSASPSSIDTVEVAYLEGMEGPQMSSTEEFMVDGLKLKIKHIVGVKAIDFRGLVYNSGA